MNNLFEVLFVSVRKYILNLYSRVVFHIIRKVHVIIKLLEIKQEKEQAEKNIEKMNKELEPIFRNK